MCHLRTTCNVRTTSISSPRRVLNTSGRRFVKFSSSFLRYTLRPFYILVTFSISKRRTLLVHVTFPMSGRRPLYIHVTFPIPEWRPLRVHITFPMLNHVHYTSRYSLLRLENTSCVRKVSDLRLYLCARALERLLRGISVTSSPSRTP